MKMSGKKEIVISAIFVLLIFVILSSLATAGFFDWFKKLTGQATSQVFNASIQITGTAPAYVNFVSAVVATAPTEGNPKQIYLEIHVNDSDGVSDVNTTAVNANFSRYTTLDTEVVRENTSCLYKGTIDAYTANFTCYVDMQYWDANGTWNISVRGKDLGAGTYS